MNTLQIDIVALQIHELSSLFDTANPHLKGDHQQSSTSSEHLLLAKTVGMIQEKGMWRLDIYLRNKVVQSLFCVEMTVSLTMYITNR